MISVKNAVNGKNKKMTSFFNDDLDGIIINNIKYIVVADNPGDNEKDKFEISL